MRKRRILLFVIAVLVAILIVFLIYRVNRSSIARSVMETNGESESLSVEATNSTEAGQRIDTEGTDSTNSTINIENSATGNINESRNVMQSERAIMIASPSENYTISHDYIKPTQEPTYSESQIQAEKWKSFGISLNGVSYSFPFSAEKIKNCGYDFDKEMKSKELGFGVINDPVVYKNKDKKSYFQVYISNRSDVTLAYSKCDIIGININLNVISDMDMEISIEGERIYKGMRTQALISAIGVPTSRSNKKTIDTLTYQNDQGTKTWVFGFDNNELIGIYVYSSPA